MRTTTIALIFSLAMSVVAQNTNSYFPQKMYEQTPNGGISFDVSKFDLSSLKNCKALIKQLKKKDSLSQYEELRTLYAIAACYDKLKKHDSTIYYLNKLMNIIEDDRYILVGNDFNNLKADSLKWQQIANRIEQSYLQLLKDNMDKELALKVFYLAIRFLRTMEYEEYSEQEQIPIEMEKIVDKQGLPLYSKVGNFASFYAARILWDSKKLPQYYPLIEDAFFKEEMIDTVLFMKITDRYMTRFMKKNQIYGTIFTSRGGSKEFILEPIESIDAVNKARREIGVTETLEEYAKKNRYLGYVIPEKYYEMQKKENE